MTLTSNGSTCSARVRFVLMVVMDPSQEFVVGLVKLRGPSFLLKKLTFPGGKIEDGELVLQAASRELLEETGVVVAPADWRVIETFFCEEYELTRVAAYSEGVLSAQTREDEPVMPLDISSHLRYAARAPNAYAPDFINTINAARVLLSTPLLSEIEKSPRCFQRGHG